MDALSFVFGFVSAFAVMAVILFGIGLSAYNKKSKD